MKKIEPGTEMNNTNLASVELIGEKNITNNKSLYIYFRPEPVLLGLKQGYSLKSIKTQHMKKSLLFLFALIIGILSVKAQPGLMDDFTSLTNGDVNGQSGWARTSGTGVQLTVDDASPFSGNLGYASAGGTGTAGGRYLLSPAYTGSGTNRYGKSFGSGFAMGTGGNACYYSVLINVSAANNADSYSFSINTGTNYVGRLFIRTEGAGYKLGISKNSNTAVYNGSPTTLSFNTTYLVVVRYFTVTSASNDQVHVWINPDLTAEPSTSSGFEVAITSGTDPSTGTYSNIHWQCVANAPTFKFDGLRVVSASGSATAWQNLMANANYYLASSGNANSVASWGSATAGTGVTPPVFTDNYHNFNLRNNATPTIGAAWTVSGTSSKAIVGDGTNACNFTIPSGFAYNGTVDVNNAGTLTIQNTTIPTLGTLATGSTVNYNGSSGQTVTGTTYSNLTISNASNVTSGGAATINGTLTLNTGKISLGANNLTLGSSASISGASSSNYIVTNSSGSVLRSIASGGGTFTFPIGRSASAYNPLTITNQGGSTSVYTVSTAATTNSTSDQINAQWSIASSASTTTDLGLGWATADAIGSLTSSPSTGEAYQYNGATWDNRGGSTSGTPNVTTVTGITSLTDPLWTVGAAAVTPDVAISASSPAAGNITRNTTDRILYGVQLVVTTGNASFTGLTVNTSGGDTYAASSAADVKNFKLWINTSNSLSGATQLGSTVSNAPAHGGSIAFTSGANLPAALTTVTGTYYLLVTCDVDAAATPGAFITIGSTDFTNISFASANKSGTDPVAAGNAQTIVDAPAVTTDAATVIATTSVTLNGTVSANALSTTVSFDYGTSVSYGSNIAANETPVTTQAAAVTANLGSLTANTLYHFRATGTNAVSTTNGSDATFTTLSLAPTADAGTNVGPTFFDANWSDPTGQGPETFTITLQVDDNNSFTTPDEYTLIASGVETYTVSTGLATGTQYYYRVRAVNAGGNSAWSGTETITTTSSTAPVLTTGTVTASSIVVGGAEVAGNDVISDGGSTITARGLVYNTTSPAETGGTLVPLGSGTTGLFDQTLSGLSANTLYYVKAYATNGIGTTYGSPEVDFVTLAAEPTTASTATIGTRTTTSLVVNFSGGDGGRRIVLVKQGSAVDGTPSDRTTYAADANFGDGDEIGTGNFVAYDGTGSSVTVTGLTINTSYHVAVFEYNNNSVSSPNYYTTAGTASATTYNPTVVVTGTLSAFGNTVAGSTSSSQSYTVEGTELISSITVTAPAGFEISEDDVDFSVNPIVLTRDGSDEVAATTIYARFAPATADGATGTLNITHTATDATTQNVAVSGNAIAASPTTAGSISFGTVTATSIVVNLPTTGDGANRIIVVKAGSAVDADPADGVIYSASAAFGSGAEIGTGNFVVYSGTGSGTNVVTVTGLSGATTYHFAVYEFNEGTGTSQNYLTPSTVIDDVTTLAASSSTDAFRSFASGDWDVPATWESFTGGNWIGATIAPDEDAASITILNTHTVTIPTSVSVTADDLTVDAGGQITIANGGTLVVANGAAATDITVNGYLLHEGTLTLTGTGLVSGVNAVYEHKVANSIAIPTNFSWGTGSTAIVSGSAYTGTGTLPTPASGNYYNLTFQNEITTTAQFINIGAKTIDGKLTIATSGAGAVIPTTTTTATQVASYEQTSGNFWANRNAGTSPRTLTVLGNAVISGGVFDIKQGSSTTTGVLNVGGDLTVGASATFTHSGSGTASLTFSGSTAQAWSHDGSFDNQIAVSVTGAGGVTLNTNLTLPSTSSLTLTSGNFTVATGNTLTLASTSSVSIASSRTLLVQGTLVRSSTGSFTTTGTFQVANGGIYRHNTTSSTFPTGTWDDGSLFEVTGNVTSSSASMNQNYYDFTWNNTAQSGTMQFSANLATVRGTLTIASTNGADLRLNAGTPASPTFNFGNIHVSSATALLDLNSGTSTPTINVPGDITIAAGAILEKTGAGATTINLGGDWSNAGTFATGTNLTVNFNGTAAQSLTGATTFANVTLNNSNGLSLGSDVTVNSALTLTAGDLSINATTLTLGGAVTRTSGNLAGSNTSNLVVNGTAGSLFFATGGTNNFLRSFTLGASATATLGNALNITAYDGTAEGVLTVTSGGVLTTGGFLTIKSNASGTARIAQGSTGGGYISGDVSVERFIRQNSSKAWRLLASNTSGQTINAAWQEGVVGGMNNPNPGFGTKITKGASTLAAIQALGFDTLSQGTALYRYNPTTDDLVAVANTNATAISSEQGYFLFIRGDRSPGQYGTSAPTTSTTLRSKGSIFQGDQSAVSTGALNWGLVRNPYPSRIDMRQIVRAGLLNDAYQVWDPALGGDFGVGGYQTFTKSGSDYIVSPGGGSYGTNGSVQNFIESGAAFFIQSTGGAGTAQVVEAAKASGSGNESFRPTTPLSGGQRLFFNVYSNNQGTINMFDGGIVFFDNAYSNAVDIEDVRKSPNFSENFGLRRSNTNLVIEKRQLINGNDTLFFNMNQLKQISYRIDVSANDIDPLITTGYLEDKYTGSSTALDLTGANNSYTFTVDANAASRAADRFMIVFRQSVVVPVSFVQVKAAQSGNDIAVEWTVANQVNVHRYEVEKSTDGRNFSSMTTVAAASRSTYNTLDVNAVRGNNYYRIKSIDNNGQVKYSEIVKVAIGKAGTSFTISPNPVQGNFINIQFAEQQAGKYGVRIINIAGQVVYNRLLQHNGGSASQSFALPSLLVSGVYQLEIVAPDNNKHVEKLIINTAN